MTCSTRDDTYACSMCLCLINNNGSKATILSSTSSCLQCNLAPGTNPIHQSKENRSP